MQSSASAASSSAPSGLSGKGASSPVRVGVIGAGIGRRHLEGYSGVRDACVVAVCDLNREKAQSLCAELGLRDVEVFTDHRAMLEKSRLDAVSLCVPNALHLPVARDCFGAGVHVLCEKPLARTADEGCSMLEAAREAGKICMVGQVLRFRDDLLELKRRADEVGPIYYARTVARRVRGIPKWGGWFTRREMAGGGPLIDTGVHLLDLAWWLAGCPRPISASGATHAQFGPRKMGLGDGGAQDENGVFDVEDLAAGFVRFETGLTLHFEASWAIAAERDERFCYLHGAGGALLWDETARVVQPDGEIETVQQTAGDPFRAEVAHFIACIQNGEHPQPDAAQGVIMMQILDALYRSARSGREAEIEATDTRQ